MLGRGGHAQRLLAQSLRHESGLGAFDRRALGPQPARQGRVAGQVDALLDGDHGRQGQRIGLLDAAVLPPGHHAVVGYRQVLDPGGDRPAELVRQPDADLVVAGVGRLVAEQHQVVRMRPDLGRDGRRGRDRAEFPAVGLQQHRPAGAEREGVPELVDRVGGAEGQHRHRAAEALGELHRLFYRALLVRADREPGHPGVDLLPVRGHRDLAADGGDPFDADEYLHRRASS